MKTMLQRLIAFIKEREAIRLRKERGDPRPWTKDSILAQYRFCNVHREDDAVSRWMRDNYYSRYSGDPDVWFAAVVGRLLNLPESLQAVAVDRKAILPFRAETFRQILHERKAAGEKNFNAAYIVSTNGRAMDKVDYIVDHVLTPLWKDRSFVRPKSGTTLEALHTRLMLYDGLGSFIAAQVIADLKYIDECPLSYAKDWREFAASGPGSRRGLNRVMGLRPEEPWKEFFWRSNLATLQKAVNAELRKLDVDTLHAQDLQNCLCEFDKYERTRLGEGVPKQLYKEKG